MDGEFIMKDELLKLANGVRDAILPDFKNNERKIIRREYGGDPHFAVDEFAEQKVAELLEAWDLPIAYFSEDRDLVRLSEKPEWMLVIDPIDGTRGAMANFETCCFSIAVCPYSEKPVFGDITNALIMELKSGRYFYADVNDIGITSSESTLPLIDRMVSLENMFWSTELTAHPINELTKVCGSLIDKSVTLGAVFVFTSSTYSLTRIVTGQLDSHVDVGHRILKDHPELTNEFLRVGRGKIVTLFPYDIAAAAFILLKAGGTVTDAYGRSLSGMLLTTDKSLNEQCSIIASFSEDLHKDIIGELKWENLEEEE
jgi:myo-inositol-1(or 4)-monophosphatase